jgi:hypothetical protein
LKSEIQQDGVHCWNSPKALVKKSLPLGRKFTKFLFPAARVKNSIVRKISKKAASTGGKR